MYDALLEETMPPSLLVTERGELVHAIGGAARFLRVRDGRQSLDVLDLVDTDLQDDHCRRLEARAGGASAGRVQRRADASPTISCIA